MLTTDNLDFLKEHGSPPRFHGNGFIQLALGPTKRLHVWHPQFPKFEKHNAQIHNHRYHISSKVHLGTLVHTTYDVVKAEDGKWRQFGVNRDGALFDMGGKWNAEPDGCYWLPKGSTYNFMMPAFHTSDASELTVTIFEKVLDDPSYAPRVMCPIGEEPTDAHDSERQPDVDDMWVTLNEAVRKAWG